MTVELQSVTATVAGAESRNGMHGREQVPNWLYNLRVIWVSRRELARAIGIGFLASLLVSVLIPKTFTSSARIMPPETSGSSSAILAALAGHAFGSDALGGLAA